MSKARKNQILVLLAIEDWVDENRRGFEISELQKHCGSVGDRTIRRVIKELHEDGLMRKENGYYYPLVSLQSTWFDDTM